MLRPYENLAQNAAISFNNRMIRLEAGDLMAAQMTSEAEATFTKIPAKRLFTVQEYGHMIAAGVLTEDERLELIRGEIRTMSPVGSRHAACVNRLNLFLIRTFGESVVVAIQNPIRLTNESEPQPDVALLRPRKDFYANSLPMANDVLLVVEVSDSTLEYDRNEKMTLYAQANITQLWVIDLIHELIEQYSQPLHGRYGHVVTHQRGESITFEQAAFAINDILGGAN